MTLHDLIAQVRASISTELDQRNIHTAAIDEIRSSCLAGSCDPTDEQAGQVRAAQAGQVAIDSRVEALRARLAELETELARDEAAAALSREFHPAAVRPAYDEVARTGGEPRTYSPATDRDGSQFLRDVARGSMYGDFGARTRLERHMNEELVERGSSIQDRAAGTGAFAGLTVPQYLVDLVAPKAQAGRPFANAINMHPLPADGMTVNISRITTGTSTAIQATENSAVSETNIDDTLLTINVQTNAGQQTLSRQAVERSSGAEDVMLQDLIKNYNTTLDNTLITQATNGLSAVATSIAYTDASPTAAELYPKLLDGAQRIETALMGQATADLAVMHPRRWGWLQSQVGSTWPFMSQPGIPVQAGGVNFANEYGSGFRGVLPSGLAVVVDANIGTASGAGTEDEIYVVASDECHLWEDPSAPVYIRAEQPALASLGVLFVVYGYFAYTFARYTSATMKIGGTGLIAPTF